MQHEAAAHDRRPAVHITPVQGGACVDASAHGVPAPGRDAERRNTNAIAPGRTMLRCCELPAACLSTEPQASKGPPAFKGRTALGADDLAKGDAYGASFRPDVANVPQQTKLGPALHRRLGAHCRLQRPHCKAENGFSCGRFSGRPIVGDGHATLPRLSPTMSSPRDGPFERPQDGEEPLADNGRTGAFDPHPPPATLRPSDRCTLQAVVLRISRWKQKSMAVVHADGVAELQHSHRVSRRGRCMLDPRGQSCLRTAVGRLSWSGAHRRT